MCLGLPAYGMYGVAATSQAQTPLAATAYAQATETALAYPTPYSSLPASGSYNTFITAGADTFSGNLGAGSAVPEPSTYAAIAGAAMLGFAGWHRRRRAPATAPVAGITVA